MIWIDRLQRWFVLFPLFILVVTPVGLIRRGLRIRTNLNDKILPESSSYYQAAQPREREDFLHQF